ncbi:PREDICTED: ATP-binding cassette sub-family B member 10, mitochondrial isoform X1 [Polistes dominula]|uniref:ATP-binding cassette sub-family B member 10, mitochondrial isoform X1 n=1 Tax=Polistes dominula TaxID=743375 RepID=A0ABM1IU99_POLDO|nr:PREDICTED: ATP-binding cassette sub-family B member 10, mitochondrial isoform X1 [Polistes dominula]
MTILCKFLSTNIIRHKSIYLSTLIRQKCVHTIWTSSKNVLLKKPCTLIALRYQTTKVLKTDIKNVPTNVISKTKRKESDLKKLILLAAPEKWRLLSAITFLIISSTVTMAVPFCLGKVIDIIYNVNVDKMAEKLNQLCIILFGVFLIGAISNFCRIYLMSTAGHRITYSLRKKAYAAILSQETAMFDTKSTGELVGRLTGDAQLVSYAVTSNVSDGLRSLIMTTSGISMMFYISPQLALVGLSVVPVVAGIAIINGRYLKKISRNVQDSLAVLNTEAEERISNIRIVKAYAQEMQEVKRYSSKLQDVLKLCYKESLYRGIFFAMTGLSGNVIILSALYYGGVMISDSTITIGNLSAFLLYAAYVGISMSGLSSFYSELNKALGASSHLFELIDRKPKIPIKGGQILENELTGDIMFQNVQFSYPTRQNSLILRDFNLHIPKHSITAIVGSSGSGKSTVAMLLLRLYDPCSGKILLDDHDLKELDPIWVKSQIGVVPQEPILFSGTIKDNILYGTENVTENEIEEISKKAHVLEFTNKMKDGLNTIVGEKGITLSGGQRQRIAIARALVKKPKILIFDEATSALDAESERFVQEALEHATHGKTVLTIAHRLSTIKNADKIVVINEGEVVEIGTYSTLINLEQGYFKNLVKHQAFT